MMVSGQDVTRLASMAKLKLGRLSRSVADSCLQFWGGRGYTRDMFISRWFLDGRLNAIGGGADEVTQKNNSICYNIFSNGHTSIVPKCSAKVLWFRGSKDVV